MTTNNAKEFEIRFECPICFIPRLSMVYGVCQHKICISCLYRGVTTFSADSNVAPTETYAIRDSFRHCPMCGLADAFPKQRPNIPEDNIAIQRQIGIMMCTVTGCHDEMWQWDFQTHISEKHSTMSLCLDPVCTPPPPSTPPTPKKSTRKRRLCTTTRNNPQTVERCRSLRPRHGRGHSNPQYVDNDL